MNDLKQVKHISVLAPEFPDIDVAQFKASVTCTATLDRDQVPSLSSSNGFAYHASIRLYKRQACGPKTFIYTNQKIETSDGRICYCRASHQCTGRSE
jgi:hypothetical protein